MSFLIKSWDAESGQFIVSHGHSTYRLTVHPPRDCDGDDCVAHNPSDHAMRDWPMLYRSDKNLFERVCPHGIGHPDPDSLKFFEGMGDTTMTVHGCDGCCAPVESGA